MLDRPTLGQIWPLAIYPTWGRGGWAEVVFKYLAIREPFDDASLREELRVRLCEIPNVHIPPSKLALRPSIALKVLVLPEGRAKMIDAMSWFLKVAASEAPSDESVG